MNMLGKARGLIAGFATVAAMNFVLSIHSASIAYTSSGFLTKFVSSEFVGIIFTAQALVTILALALLPSIIRSLGAWRLIILCIPALQAATIFFAFAQSPIAAIIFFTVIGIGVATLSYLLDLYLETVTREEKTTGNVRGTYLTAMNLAIFFAPLAIALLVFGDAYFPLYVAMSVLLTAALVLALTSLKKLSPSSPRNVSLAKMYRRLSDAHTSIPLVLAASFLLQTFYAWIVIYTPLYLIEYGGFSWQTIGLMTAFALVPFLVMEIPLGIVADRWLGEKEIMTIGFAVMGLATAALSFIPLSLIVVWAIALFTTRIGAAMVEIMTETYFFKQVNEKDPELVSLFRAMRPAAYVVGPLLALAILPFAGLQYAFAFFGILLLLGVPLALKIVDTK